MNLRTRPRPHPQWGYADFFNDRHKKKILDLADAKPSDVVFDLGCGDASFLIFAVERYGVKKAVGHENMPQRLALSRRNVRHHKLADKITINGDDMNDEVNLSEADVILDMLPQGSDDDPIKDFETASAGTRIIKHDLPLIGFLPDRVDYPFYRHTLPLVQTPDSAEWSSRVLTFLTHATLDDVWHELFYYGCEKGYSKWDIRDFVKLAKKRFR